MNVLQTRSELLLGKTIFDMNLNVGYYARVSTDKDDQLNSLENQSNYFREMIGENKKWNLIGEYIDEISLDGEMLKYVGSTRHYCELYIWRFLDLENIQEQTFINNMRKQFSSIRNSSYTQLYCSKKICNKYIKDFDKYIIQNKLI